MDTCVTSRKRKAIFKWEVVQVLEGAAGGRSIHLEVFLRREDDAWKIYRVRDITNHHEHPIFNAGAITRAKSSAESAL